MGKETKSTEKEGNYVINLKRSIDEINLQERIEKSFKYLKDLTNEKKEETKEKF